MNCFIYVRVSTDKQADKDLSLPAQLAACRQYAQERTWSILEEFVEPGVSARTAERPELRRLLTQCRNKADAVEVVLVHKIDRLARNVADHATIRTLLQQRGIKLISVTENLEDSVSGQLVENIMAAMAEFYSGNLADEVRKGLRQRVLQGGWPHKPPRGYVVRRDGNRSQVEIHGVDGPLMAQAFEWYATGHESLRQIATRLAQAGVVSSRGSPLATQHIRHLLTNPFYTGQIVWKDLHLVGQHRPLVSVDLFERVQRMLVQRHRDVGIRTDANGFPLLGLARCASCRGRMSRDRQRRWNYYRCSRQAYRKQTCDARYCNVDRAHGDLEQLCRQICVSDEVTQSLHAAVERVIEKQAAAIRERISMQEHERGQLLATEIQLTDAFIAGDVSSNVYRLKSAELRAHRTRLAKSGNQPGLNPEQLRAKVRHALASANSVWDVYTSLPVANRPAFLATVFTMLLLGPEGVMGFTLTPPFEALATTADGKDFDALAHALLDAA